MPNQFNYLDGGFGVEFECYLPEGTTQSQAAAAVAARIGAPCVVESYNHRLRTTWKIVPDGSLHDYSRGAEFVSPILRGEAGLAEVERVCQALTDFGCTVNKSCGYHVHVGVGSPPVSFFKNLVKLYAAYEPVLDSIMPVSRRNSNNMLVRSMTSVRPVNVDAAVSLTDVIRAVSREESRFYKLNLCAYLRHRTVEFRHHSGTLDSTKARTWATLCLRMVAAALNGTTVGSAPLSANHARVGSKAHQVGQMLLRPEGVTGREVCAALSWPSVSMPAQARICGLEFTTQRSGREVRYFARSAAVESRPANPITIDGFASTIGATETERNYLRQRAANLGGAIAWAA